MPRQTQPRDTSSVNPTRASLDNRPVIYISAAQLQRAEEIARKRNASYDSIGGGRVCGDQTSHEAHFVGVLGEIACSNLLGVPLADEIWEHGDPGHDLEYRGVAIDVKTSQTTAIEHPDLIVPVEPRPTADLFLQTHWTQNAVRVLGFAELERVLARQPVRAPGSDLNYIVPPEDLTPPQELLEQKRGISVPMEDAA